MASRASTALHTASSGGSGMGRASYVCMMVYSWQHRTKCCSSDAGRALQARESAACSLGASAAMMAYVGPSTVSWCCGSTSVGQLRRMAHMRQVPGSPDPLLRPAPASRSAAAASRASSQRREPGPQATRQKSRTWPQSTGLSPRDAPQLAASAASPLSSTRSPISPSHSGWPRGSGSVWKDAMSESTLPKAWRTRVSRACSRATFPECRPSTWRSRSMSR
mmetsp:Transcript_15704/g.48018  ORF Transcript_15704/g.48018 Transcript_15704/m.48018 type:complete len:221 (+) Transcript_15704:728-1390(+)